MDRAPEKLQGRPVVALSAYSGDDFHLYSLSSKAQALAIAPRVHRDYAAAGWPPGGIAMRVADGAWFAVDVAASGEIVVTPYDEL